MVPDDEVEALATRNVVRAVAPRAQMYDARAHAMMVRVLVAAVVRRADHPTEHSHTFEVPPETHVERHCEVNARWQSSRHRRDVELTESPSSSV